MRYKVYFNPLLFTCCPEDGGGCSQNGSDTKDCCVQALLTLGGGRNVDGGRGGGSAWERFMDDVDGFD